ncbi:MAG: phosphotransferase family protein [Acidimicrobiaceae bacterium]|jgi:aminoglycoside phosphotransferase (APT) family kinase protein|nr:phosphotransferase family protein [Acidimicrobiaceae bacterium]MBT5580148.1 phosphotransferase family protein [Acidimicrobiaceae bacterium]MBT5852075.1 phosphotransferase family protein [Acidimicrobiaceae bacterium]
MSTPTGINADAVTDWIAGRVDGLATPLTFDQIEGGASNLTYRVTDAAGVRYVLRRPPTGHVLASAHDMSREHRIMSALQDTEVPVPPLVGLCDDVSVNDAPFFVMGFVDGSIVFDLADGEAVEPALRPTMTDSLVDTLVLLHAVNPNDVGLGELGRKEDYCARQLRRWKRQIDEGSDREIPLLNELHARLEASIPPQQGAGIVHGDYRLDNCMMGFDGKVAAVLDWELCTLGDVLADLAGMVMWWGDDPEARGRIADVPTRVDGFGTADHVVARYAASSDRDISALPWYIAFQHWRLACISEGVRVRYSLGAMGDQETRDDDFSRDNVDGLLEGAQRWISQR